MSIDGGEEPLELCLVELVGHRPDDRLALAEETAARMVVLGAGAAITKRSDSRTISSTSPFTYALDHLLDEVEIDRRIGERLVDFLLGDRIGLRGATH